jgi:hypothetical protein
MENVFAYLVVVIMLVALSGLAYWKYNPVMFLVLAGMSMELGLYTPHALKAIDLSGFGTGVGLTLILYSFICIALTYASLFKGERSGDKR